MESYGRQPSSVEDDTLNEKLHFVEKNFFFLSFGVGKIFRFHLCCPPLKNPFGHSWKTHCCPLEKILPTPMSNSDLKNYLVNIVAVLKTAKK